jgi:hypothetical protein
VKESKNNDEDDDSVSFGHIFDILRTIKCKDSCYELLIGIQSLHTSLCHVQDVQDIVDITFATVFGYVRTFNYTLWFHLLHILWGSRLS